MGFDYMGDLIVDRLECKAYQVSDQMRCERCDLLWDINDPEPPGCRPVVNVGTPGNIDHAIGAEALVNIKKDLNRE